MKTINIFIASSVEFDKERKKIGEVIEFLNKEFEEIKIVLLKWEIDVAPDFNNKGSQKVINPILKEANIVVILIRKRIGLGTEEEFKIVNKYRTKYKIPRILVYFDITPINIPNSLPEINSLKDVVLFKNKIKNKSLYWEYNREEESLLELLKSHLKKHINKLYDSGDIDLKIEFDNEYKEKSVSLIGRDVNFDEIKNIISGKFSHILYIYGINGIGKTSLILELCNDLNKKQKIYEKVIWYNISECQQYQLTFEENFYTKICNVLDIDIVAEDQFINKTNVILSHISEIKEKILIVLDNFENLIIDNEESKQFFRNLNKFPTNYKFIIISCKPIESTFNHKINEYQIPPINAQSSEALIKLKYELNKEYKPDLKKINLISKISDGIPILMEWYVEIDLFHPDIDLYNISSRIEFPEKFRQSILLMLKSMDTQTQFLWNFILIASRFGYKLKKTLIKAIFKNYEIDIKKLEHYPLIKQKEDTIEIIQAIRMMETEIIPNISEKIILDKIAAYYLGVVSSTLKQKLESYNKTEEFKNLLDEKENLIKSFDYFIEQVECGEQVFAFFYRLIVYQYANDISWFLWIHGFFTERIKYLEKACEIALKYEEEPYKCIANINDVAWTYFHLNDLKKAEDFIKRLDNDFLRIAAKSNIRYKALIDRLKANLYIRQKQNEDEIIPLLESTKRIFEEIGEKRRIASINNEIGEYYFYNKDYKTSLKYYKTALTICKNINEKHSLPIYYLHIGKALLMKYKSIPDKKTEQDLNVVIQYLQKGLKSAHEINRKQIEGEICLTLSQALVEKKEKSKIINKYLKNAKLHFEQIKDKSNIEKVDSIILSLKTFQK